MFQLHQQRRLDFFILIGKPSKSFIKIISTNYFYCSSNAGGGGERVLWLAVYSLFQTQRKIDIYLYTNDKSLKKLKLLEDVKVR